MIRQFISLGILFAGILSISSCDTLQQAGMGGFPSASGGSATAGTSGGTPTSSEITSGIKQALQIGLQDGVKQVSAVDGYFKNPLIKILFPPNAVKVENTLRNIGLGDLCDKVELSINRAAEDAAKQAGPIFLNALNKMTLKDASQILLGPDTAATSYFRRATTSELTAKFSPVISNSLNKVGATRYWSDVMTKYNQIPLVKPINPDLTAYVTQRAIDGLFVIIAGKETQIRQQLSARTTPLLQKVFGYAAKQAGSK
jgi:hypothetical protein